MPTLERAPKPALKVVKGGLRLNRGVLWAGLLWLVLWMAPWAQLPRPDWGSALTFVMDMLRLALAMCMFVVPGILSYLLIRSRNTHSSADLGIFPAGFALSVFGIGVIGLIGRIAGLSFPTVARLFGLFGLIEIVLLARVQPKWDGLDRRAIEWVRGILTNVPLLMALLLVTLMEFRGDLFFIDDTTYLAYLTNWLHSGRLGFNNLIYGVGVTEAPRFWLALYPMGQALLTWLSGVPGILLFSNYLELFLVPLAVLSSYWLSRRLGLSRPAAGIAVLLQVTFYAWMQGDQWPPGMWFYQNMAEDKVTAAFILAPVFLVLTLTYLRTPTPPNLVLLSAVAFSLALTHPILLFFTCLVAGGVALFRLISKRSGWRSIVGLALVCGAALAPYALIVYGGGEAHSQAALDPRTADASFEIDRYVRSVGAGFYGLNPGVLEFFDFAPASGAAGLWQAFRLFPAVVALGAGFLSVHRLKRGPAYWYTLSSVSLVALATIPYTGWLLGYFVSTRLIVRASWFLPVGLAGVLLLRFSAEKLEAWGLFRGIVASGLGREPLRSFALSCMCIALASPIVAWAVLPGVPRFFQTLDHGLQLAEIGTYIDSHTDGPTTAIALDYNDNLRLPGVAAHVRLISFREELDYDGQNFFLSLEQINQRKHASSVIRSLDDASLNGERCDLLRQFAVRYVISPKQTAEAFESAVSACSPGVDVVDETRDMELFEFR